MPSPPGIVLVLTCEEDATANLVIAELNARGARMARVDTADIGPGLSFAAHAGAGMPAWAGWLRTPSRHIPIEDVRSVYYRRPSLWRFDHLDPQAAEFARAEARHGLKGTLAALPACRYVNHPHSVDRAEVKPVQLQIAADVGFEVPATLITNDPAAVAAFAAEHGPIVYKSMRGVPAAPGGQVGAIWAQRIDPADVDDSLAITAHLFQAEVPKTADARVTVVAGQVFAQQITTPDGALDWRRGDWDHLCHTPIDVPAAVAAAARAYLDRLGLVFGCFDFALQESPGSVRWTFLECNPNGQWGWLPDAPAIASAFADTLLEGSTT
ncbi:ATP-grasp ribosomal peptide maturase [Nonomuraea wenchangensis]